MVEDSPNHYKWFQRDTKVKAVEEHLKKLDRDVEDLGEIFKNVGTEVERSNQTLQNLCSKQDRMEM